MPKAKVRKAHGEKVRATKVHEQAEEFEPTVEEGLEEFYQDSDEDLWGTYWDETQ